jgi:formylglycine-generating enzyme required for sulfatase activity
MLGTGGWKNILSPRVAFAVLLLGLVLAGGGLWLSGEFKSTVVISPEDGALPLSEPEAPTTALGISEPTAERPNSRFVNEVHRDALRSGGRGPALVKLPGDSFTMGTDRYAPPEIEKPSRPEQLDDFYISRFEVSFDEYDAFARASGLEPPPDQGWGRGSRPVINVSWDSARAYTAWLSRQTGHHYRLPSEAEWEYAMGSGSEGIYWWGNAFEQGQEICFNCGTEWDGRSTAPVGSARPNPFGLYDMGGNVMEWVGDCLAGNTAASGDCATRVVRGGAFNKPNYTLRTTTRRGLEADSLHSTVGFRVVREAGK